MNLERVNDFHYILPKQDKMKVEAHIFASQSMINQIKNDRTLIQLKNISTLPTIYKKSVLMPDAHEGYGFPIGGVAAFGPENPIVSPGGIGYDINCGVRLLSSTITYEEFLDKRKAFIEDLFKTIPVGLGEEHKKGFSIDDLDLISEIGIDWAIENGMADKKHKNLIEEKGRMKGEPTFVSNKAKKRGKKQLGTLGAGNHFIEIQTIEKLFNSVSKSFYLNEEGLITVMIHTGSRGFGHQIASDYIDIFMKHFKGWIADKELVYAHVNTDIAQQYLGAMRAAVNFAFVNRQLISHGIERLFEKYFNTELKLVYDLSHNIAKFEKHKKQMLLVHRKGATRAFPAGRKELPEKYIYVGQPVLVPGSMGTGSYVLVAQPNAMELSFGSSCHGAGRKMSRRKAKQSIKGEVLLKQLYDEGIYVRSKTFKGVAEEAPFAYKDIDEVVRTIEKNNIANTVARLKPVAVIKG